MLLLLIDNGHAMLPAGVGPVVTFMAGVWSEDGAGRSRSTKLFVTTPSFTQKHTDSPENDPINYTRMQH